MTVEAYKKYICPNCKNKDKYLCDIRYRYDNTLYCTGYDTNIEKRKKIASKLAKVVEKC